MPGLPYVADLFKGLRRGAKEAEMVAPMGFRSFEDVAARVKSAPVTSSHWRRSIPIPKGAQVAPMGFRSFADESSRVANFARNQARSARQMARSAGRPRRMRRYAIKGGLAAGALGTAYGVGKSSGIQGITPQATGSGGYPTGIYGM